MVGNNPTINRRASELARAFGALVRQRRQALGMSQDQVALTTGVGRRFLIDLEAGKMTCQLGRGLVVAEAVGLRPVDALTAAGSLQAAAADLPDLPDEED
jgi:transcriptional regulator with XRE-family HTH domain